MSGASPSASSSRFGDRNRCSFKEAQLRVGDPMFIECPRLLEKLRDKVSIVGWQDDKFLIITAPRNSVLRDALQSGEDVILRTFQCGSAYAFRTAVLQPVRALGQLLFLSYPEVVECATIRETPRARVALPASLSIDEAEHSCVVRNLSAHGALLETSKSLKPGDVVDAIKLSFDLQGVPVALKVAGEVRRVEPDAAGARGHYGLAFRDLQANEKLALAGFVTNEILKDRDNAT